ncbi:hypothetical protein B7Z17_01030 [Candidatus Saccharibacteria bacterium 32-49-10]|nr:MAG: hypothetical protein B7Z17_01030 [Candidatus Saccharibacteria bacterium 32-49-10]
MKLLDGSELSGYIKERQAKQVRALRQAWKVIPRLAIIETGTNPVSDVYVRLKQKYGEDILVEVERHRVDLDQAFELVEQLNRDPSIHGIIIQLPLSDPSRTDELVNAISSSKDVDGLGASADYISATATAIDWLLAGYNVTLTNKKIAIVGQGRLVGAPLTKLWRNAGYEIETYDENSADELVGDLNSFDIVVTATGRPSLIKPEMLKPGAVVVDAGTATENDKVVGDVDESVRLRTDLTITPKKGGVGPLTIAALFDNVITAARKLADEQGKPN